MFAVCVLSAAAISQAVDPDRTTSRTGQAEYTATSARDTLRQLISHLHADELASRRDAEQTLRGLGLTDADIEIARRFSDPSPEVRRQLVQELGHGDIETRRDVLDELARDSDAAVRGEVEHVRHQMSRSLPSRGSRTRESSVRSLATSATEVGLIRQTSHAAQPPSDQLSEPVSLPIGRLDSGLDPPGEVEAIPDPSVLFADPASRLEYPPEAPLGFTGPSGVLPREVAEGPHFVPVEDRWRIGFPEWDRYGKGHPPVDDYPYVEGHWWDPFNQNVLKGDYPIIGQHTFLNVTAESFSILETRQVPTFTSGFESTRDPRSEEQFGNPNQFFYTHNLKLSFDLFHGDAAFKPVDWRIRLTPIFNMNYLDVEELAVVNPDVREGTTRFRDRAVLQEWFVEAKLADLGPDYDFVSARAGQQFFRSDFRGFIFDDTNRGVRLFGTQFANRDQFNLVWFDMVEKDTNSQLNTFDDRHQNVVIANYFRQDFIVPGYTAEASIHYNRDGPSFLFDRNDFLARPDPTGIFQQHKVQALYLGVAGDGHIGRINVSHAFYWALGKDSLNPLAGKPQEINAQMAALEFSYDRDWARFRTSFFYGSGDRDIHDEEANGFDSILDNPSFAGGGFSYWQRQQIALFGVNLVQRQSLIPDLRSSKIQGQSNFVNPGLLLLNFGFDADVTPKTKFISNVNFLWFDQTAVLEQFVFQDHIEGRIGTDLSAGVEYRPFLNDNVILVGGVSWLIPGEGFKDIYQRFQGDTGTFVATFLQLAMTF
ncbi:MAG: HEAT repeat domain-containing protein [Planctomycetales bacterium]|nr:HEAT repeat domain-containing protein [Planctomycetales bacterium]